VERDTADAEAGTCAGEGGGDNNDSNGGDGEREWWILVGLLCTCTSALCRVRADIVDGVEIARSANKVTFVYTLSCYYVLIVHTHTRYWACLCANPT